MNIYLAHSREFDFIKELYHPIKLCNELWLKHKIFLPHDDNSAAIDTKSIIQNSDLIIAEVSFASTGMGVELGWANANNKNIICIHKYNCLPSSSLHFISKIIRSYRDENDLIKILLAQLKKHQR